MTTSPLHDPKFLAYLNATGVEAPIIPDLEDFDPTARPVTQAEHAAAYRAMQARKLLRLYKRFLGEQ
jgi:hypothetical protein